MPSSKQNRVRKQNIEQVMTKYEVELVALKQKRNKVVKDYIDALKSKKITDIRKQVEQLYDQAAG